MQDSIVKHIFRTKQENRMSPTTAAYFAGIIDGEGTISFTKRPVHNRDGKVRYYYGLSLHVTSTDKSFMEALLLMVPYGDTRNIYEYKYKKERKHCKTAYRVLWRHHVAKEILKDCFPYLIIKRKHAGLIIDLFEVMRISTELGERKGRVGSAYPQWIHDLQEVVSFEISELNKRGNCAC